jgi:hypothetical protein
MLDVKLMIPTCLLRLLAIIVSTFGVSEWEASPGIYILVYIAGYNLYNQGKSWRNAYSELVYALEQRVTIQFGQKNKNYSKVYLKFLSEL